MTLGIIWAQNNKRVIGKNGKLPWHIPEDLKHFKTLTQGCAVIMGRKTWQSLPPPFQPLPHRNNIVLTHSNTFSAPGALIAATLDQALFLAEPLPVWVIGGSSLYEQALHLADRLEVTEIDDDSPGDAYAPEIPEFWDFTQGQWLRSTNGFSYRFITGRK